MTDEFTGNPVPLTADDYTRAAAAIGCPVAAIRAVVDVESRGGFLPDGRPRILFERHKFHNFTAGAWDAAHPAISAPTAGGYLGGAREYDRLAEALSLDRPAALKSASWGAFQIMGFNHAAAGHADVEAFVAAMVSGEGAQLEAFVAFISASALAHALATQDWIAFARGYNGPAFARFGYHLKLAAAYARHVAEEASSSPSAPPQGARATLRLGARGPAVRELQRLLGIPADGAFGPVTHGAVLAGQHLSGLVADGVAGPRTWEALRARAPA